MRRNRKNILKMGNNINLSLDTFGFNKEISFPWFLLTYPVQQMFEWGIVPKHTVNNDREQFISKYFSFFFFYFNSEKYFIFRAPNLIRTTSRKREKKKSMVKDSFPQSFLEGKSYQSVEQICSISYNNTQIHYTRRYV